MDMNEWRKSRYALFNRKIDSMKDHPKYDSLRKQADEAMMCNEGWGLDMIHASDFIERIEQADEDYIREWLDGKNQLMWKEIESRKANR